MIWSDRQDVARKVLMDIVCAEAPAALAEGFDRRQRQVEIGTRFVSSRASTIQTSLGQSTPSSWCIRRSDNRSRSNSGTTVCVKPV